MVTTDKQKKQTVFPTILVVDDILENLLVFQQLIKHNLRYHRVLLTTDPGEGFKMANAHQPDAILLDFQMPGSNGIELCKRLKAVKSLEDTPILLFTGNLITPELKAKGLKAGATDFIAKPIDMVEFIDKIKTVLFAKYSGENFINTHSRVHSNVSKKMEKKPVISRNEKETARQI
ncbi:response regulator [bacterium]|nr:response regulator [bacterium]